MKHVIRFFFGFMLVSVSLTVHAIEILSKNDARKTFSMSFDEWRGNLRATEVAGVGKFLENSKYELTLFVKMPGGILSVTPSYLPSKLDRPHRIAVSVNQDPFTAPFTRTLKDVDFQEMFEAWRRDMSPEYTLFSNVSLREGAQYNMLLFETGVYPEMDDLSKASKGCWKRCVQR